MSRFKNLGNTFFISAVMLWIIPIIVYGFYYATFVKLDESDLQEKNMTSVGTIISSKVNYENNYFIDAEFLSGVELGNSYNVIILNDFGDVIYSRDNKFADMIYSSPEVISILGGNVETLRSVNENIMTIYVPIRYKKTNVGVVIISQNVKNKILANVKVASNMITLTLVISLSFFTLLLAVFITRPLSKFKNNIVDVSKGRLQDVELRHEYADLYEISDVFNKMLDSTRRLERNRQQFVSDVSHELKTPLTSMKVLADTLLSQKDAPKEMYDDFMSDISHEVDRESKIIDDLLTIASLDKKYVKVNYEMVSINSLLEQLMRVLLPLAKEKGVILELNSLRNVEAFVDETKVYLAIMNLMENAIKYNVNGGKVTTIIDADFRSFIIKISDTGIGIPDDEVEHVFDRFYRVDKMRSRDSGGTGLGLSIVQRVVQMHGGSINCHSELGIGTSFTITLPLRKWENTQRINA